MIVPREKRASTLTLESQDVWIQVRIIGRLSPRQRRTFGAAFIRQMRPWMKYVRSYRFRHEESQLVDFNEIDRRGNGYFESKPISDSRGRWGTDLRLARQEREWSQEELARRTGLRAATLSALERGLTRPRISTIRKLERGFGNASFLQTANRKIE